MEAQLQYEISRAESLSKRGQSLVSVCPGIVAFVAVGTLFTGREPLRTPVRALIVASIVTLLAAVIAATIALMFRTVKVANATDMRKFVSGGWERSDQDQNIAYSQIDIIESHRRANKFRHVWLTTSYWCMVAGILLLAVSVTLFAI